MGSSKLFSHETRLDALLERRDGVQLDALPHICFGVVVDVGPLDMPGNVRIWHGRDLERASTTARYCSVIAVLPG